MASREDTAGAVWSHVVHLVVSLQKPMKLKLVSSELVVSEVLEPIAPDVSETPDRAMDAAECAVALLPMLELALVHEHVLLRLLLAPLLPVVVPRLVLESKRTP